MAKSEQDFQVALDNIFTSVVQIPGISGIKIKSGDLHEVVGDYTGKDHRMPVCCATMRKNMKEDDKIIGDTPSGQSASLIILYQIPR
jgi:hypothetical protein